MRKTFFRALIILSIIIPMFQPAFAAGDKKRDKEFGEFICGFKKALQSDDKEQLASMIKFPIRIGYGGDSFYNYEFINKNDFVSNNYDYYNSYIHQSRKRLLSMNIKKCEVIVKKGANLVSFTCGFDIKECEGDGKDYASFIADGTVVYVYEFCWGIHGPCVGYFFSRFGDGWKLWGITWGG